MKKQSKKPLKTTKMITSSRNTPRLNIEQHFKHSKKIIPNQGIESLPFVLDSEESVQSLTFESKKRTKTPKTPLKEPQGTSPITNLSDLSNVSLDKKVEIINDKITAIEQDIAHSFRSQSNLVEKFPCTPAPSHTYPSEYCLSPLTPEQVPKFYKNLRFDSRDFPGEIPLPFADLDEFYKQIDSVRSHKSTIRSPILPLFDLNKFDKPVISKDDPSYILRNEISEYRRKLKKDVLPDKIEKILSDKCKKNISVQYEEPIPSVDGGVIKETDFGSEAFDGVLADANIPAILQEDRFPTHGYSTPHSQRPLSPRTAIQDLGLPLDHIGELTPINTLNLGNKCITPLSNTNPALPINKEELQKNYKAAFDEIEALTQFLSTAEQKLTNIKTDFQTCLIQNEDYTLPSDKESKSREKEENTEASTKPIKGVTKHKSNFIQLNRANVIKEKKTVQKPITPKKKVILKAAKKKQQIKTREKGFNITYDIFKTPSGSSSLSDMPQEKSQHETPLTKFEVVIPKVSYLSDKGTSPIYFSDENLFPNEIKSKNSLAPGALLTTNFVEIGIQAQQIPSFTVKETLKDEAVGTNTPIDLNKTAPIFDVPNKINKEADHFDESKNKLAKLTIQKMPKIEIQRPLTKQLAPTLIITPQESVALQPEFENIKYVQCIADGTNVNHFDSNTKPHGGELQQRQDVSQLEHKQNDIQLEKKQNGDSKKEKHAPQNNNESNNDLSTVIEEISDDSSLTIEKIKQKTLENTELIKEKRKTLTDELNLKMEDIPSINTLKAIQNYLEKKRISIIQQDFALKNLDRIRPSSVVSDVSPDTSFSEIKIKERNFRSETLTKPPTNLEIKTCFEQSKLLLEKMKNLSFKTQNLSTKVETDIKEIETRAEEEKELKLKDATVLFQKPASSDDDPLSIESCSQSSLDQTKSSLKSNLDAGSKTEDATDLDSYSDDFEKYYQTGQSSVKTLKTKEKSSRFDEKDCPKLETIEEKKDSGDTYSISSTERSIGTDPKGQMGQKETARLSAGNGTQEQNIYFREKGGGLCQAKSKRHQNRDEEQSLKPELIEKVQNIQKSKGTDQEQNLSTREGKTSQPKAQSNKRSVRLKEEQNCGKNCKCDLRASKKIISGTKKDLSPLDLKKEEEKSSEENHLLLGFRDKQLQTSYRQEEEIIERPFQEISIQTDDCDCNQKDITKITQQTEEMRMELSNLNILSKIRHEASVQTEDSKLEGKRNVTFERVPTELLLNIDLENESQGNSKENSPKNLTSKSPNPLENRIVNNDFGSKMAEHDKMVLKQVPIICSPECPRSKKEKDNSTFNETHYLNLPGTSRESSRESRGFITNYEYLQQYENTNYDKTIPIYNLFVNPSYSTPIPRLFERSSPQKHDQTPTPSSSSETYTEPIDTLSEGEIMYPCKCSTSIGETHLCKFAKNIKMKLNKSAKCYPNKILIDSIGIKNIGIQKQRRNMYTDNFVTYTYSYKNGRMDLSSTSDPNNSSSSEYTSSYP